MKISRLGHFARVAAAGLAALGVELLTNTTSPLVHAAWAPAALLGLRWLIAELGGSSGGAG